MNYKGKLYGHLNGDVYFDTGKTSDDWDVLEKRAAELEEENKVLQHCIKNTSIQQSELLLAFANSLNEECGFPLNSEGFGEYIEYFLKYKCSN